MICLGVKITAALWPWRRSGRGDLGGEQTRRPEGKATISKHPPHEVSLRGDPGKPTHWRDVGKADDVGEETGKCTLQPGGIMAQASWERLAEITSEPVSSRGSRQPARTSGDKCGYTNSGGGGWFGA